jgi:hypothetical protein
VHGRVWNGLGRDMRHRCASVAAAGRPAIGRLERRCSAPIKEPNLETVARRTKAELTAAQPSATTPKKNQSATGCARSPLTLRSAAARSQCARGRSRRPARPPW